MYFSQDSRDGIVPPAAYAMDNTLPAMNLATDGRSIDRLIDHALTLCDRLPSEVPSGEYRRRIEDLRERLARGSLRLAVLGQFNRGKSTFINALLGLPVLPISVLPITSVPTVIRHGPRPACNIRFGGNRPDTGAVESIEEIERVLERFVAEENNPRNREGVAEATVECDSEILRHGTVLIDTPGFGSTHVHNTRTTFGLLETCDAALFLLSADLPITQVEVDFLREARRRVRRVFFIFNKVDLLAPEELRTTQDFVRAALLREGLPSTEVRLFPVRARMAQQAASGSGDDEAWRESGMETVRAEIVDFMLREKYFALSEALDTKFRGAVEEIVAALRQVRDETEAPFVRLRDELDALGAGGEEIRGWMSSRDEAIQAERSETEKRIETALGRQARMLSDRLEERLDRMLSGGIPSPRHVALVESTLAMVLEEGLARAGLEVAGEVNGSLREAYRRRSEQVERVCSAAAASTGDEGRTRAEGIDGREPTGIDVSRLSPRSPSLVLPPGLLRRSVAERFSGADAARRRVRERLGPVVLDAAREGCTLLAEELRREAGERIEEHEQAAVKRVAPVAEELERRFREKQSELQTRREAAAPRLGQIEALIERFEELVEGVR